MGVLMNVGSAKGFKDNIIRAASSFNEKGYVQYKRMKVDDLSIAPQSKNIRRVMLISIGVVQHTQSYIYINTYTKLQKS
jgi:hypothetical protein